MTRTDATVIPLGCDPAEPTRLSPLGLDPPLERAYRAMLERPAWTSSELAERLCLDAARATRLGERLVDLGLVTAQVAPTGDDPAGDGPRLRPLNPVVGLAALLAEREAELARAGRDLDTSRLVAADLAVDFAGRHGVRVDIARSPAAIRSTVEALVQAATTEILIMSAGGGPDPIDAVSHLDPGALRPGVRCRAVFPDAARVDPATSRRLARFAHRGGAVRTGPVVPVHSLVIDNTVLALPADGQNRAGVSVLRLAGAVTTTVALFERIWQSATPLHLCADAEDTRVARRERELLTLLAEGATDESAALRLGVSVRTVRRMVADVMGRLGARSRFQAGMKATESGWFER